jgi:hypothetical protein
MHALGSLIAILVASGAYAASGADSVRDPSAYAILVGSRGGGEGQRDLRFAGLDAQRMAELLVELGRYQRDRIRLLLDPTTAEIWTAFDEVEAELAARSAAGERGRFLFYYSGHARAQALSLGREEVALDHLRARLVSMPSPLTLAVLDACQSGAVSGVKGAAPAADFSASSVAALNQEGLVVLASSSGSELSQESEQLRASYFTHHLMAALRGAGDGNHDGRVSLDEAYAYAYNRTLADTASTAVGGQHPTLETNLKGKGTLVLTYPDSAERHLTMAESTAAQVVLFHEASGTLVAELLKAPGAPLRVALPAGSYLALVRVEETTRRCVVDLSATAEVALDPSVCAVARLDGVTKGDLPGVEQAWEKAVVYLERQKSPVTAAWLAAVPLPGGLGHAYADTYWPQGAFFSTLEAGELAALLMLWVHTGIGRRERDYLFDHYGVEPVNGGDPLGLPRELSYKGVLIGVGLAYLATKLWEVLDAHATATVRNEELRSRLRALPVGGGE